MPPSAIQALSIHGTGTPLGDPIEVGAAVAAFRSPSQYTAQGRHAGPHPLALEASKSHQGHAEPAAGVVGLLHAAHGLVHGMSHPILHLRALNPFLAAALLGGSCRVGRQQSPSAVGHASAPASSVSAFAFQVGIHVWSTCCYVCLPDPT